MGCGKIGEGLSFGDWPRGSRLDGWIDKDPCSPDTDAFSFLGISSKTANF
jgi:hypothetical protein